MRLLPWPLKKYDARFICMADCYKFKGIDDIDKNFCNNLDIVLELPKHHTDVFWSLPDRITAEPTNSVKS